MEYLLSQLFMWGFFAGGYVFGEWFSEYRRRKRMKEFQEYCRAKHKPLIDAYKALIEKN